MTSEVQVVFKTNLPEEFQAPEVQISIGTSSTNKELTQVQFSFKEQLIFQILKQLLADNGDVDIKGKKFNFMVNNVFITTSVQEYSSHSFKQSQYSILDKQSIQNEELIEIYYQFSLEKPKPTHSMPQEEWISTIKSLSHILNEKAKTYAVGFFNGDVKIFNKKDHKELLSIKQLHQDSIIQDALFLKNDALDKKLLVTCSTLPNSELRVSEIIERDRKYHFNQIAQSKHDEYSNINDGFKCLGSNPMNNEFICSAYQTNDSAPEKAILIWRLNKQHLEDSSQKQLKMGEMKRLKTNITYISAHQNITCGGGIQSMKWATPSRIYVGCSDHSVKIVNVEQAQIEEVLFTTYKVPTCIDSIQETLLLTGHEDATVKLWDIRTGVAERKYKSQYESHKSWISQVKVNSNVENVFVSGSYDGTVKMWDLRNEERPLATLKRKNEGNSDDYKVFALEWNGASQILSGGSDSHISVHSLA
ncbi:ribosome biogenesis protein wdr12 [Stylonychia lemnae]|uniref:Ribosome biogenesis protein wdr12 n=1 Tax=Stylonychia lemnae TaxID=5949 RepID=A0A077ZUQ7_STYLE|nr:ribosome biogenesis protein wdr12 [Stylonychia lemnae]|eukprot:CDW73040.1 ribosome biogenesis protein wdr12 [Stylonychia lemnae]